MKKGFVASTLVDFYAYILFIVVIFIFFLLFSFAADKKEQQISASSDILAGNTYAMTHWLMCQKSIKAC